MIKKYNLVVCNLVVTWLWIEKMYEKHNQVHPLVVTSAVVTTSVASGTSAVAANSAVTGGGHKGFVTKQINQTKF